MYTEYGWRTNQSKQYNQNNKDKDMSQQHPENNGKILY